MAGECVTDCKFCIIHHYGVYVLNIGGFLVLCLVLVVYWKEVSNFFKNKPKLTSQANEQQDLTNQAENQPQSPQQQPSTPFADTPTSSNLESSMTKTTIINQGLRQPVIPQPFISPLFPPMNQIPQVQPIIMPIGALETPQPNKNRPPKANQRSKRAKTMAPVKAVPSPDPYKLPTPETASYESTGSNYFKQVMHGKKGVASISQYDAIKKKDKHHHHHKHHHSHKKDKK